MIHTKKQKLVFALITVLITVPCFVFYCLALENGGLKNIDIKYALILILIEYVIAYLSAIFIGSPLALKLAFKKVNPKENSHLLVETSIICATVCIMCPWMSFLATILYTGILPSLIFNDVAFSVSTFFINFIPNFLETLVLNFPFALFSQLFFIQPLVRKIFASIYKNNKEKN